MSDLSEFLLARIGEDEARVRPMLSEAWPQEVVVQVGDGERQACVTIGAQETPKAYLRVWRPGTERQVEFGWQANGTQVWGPEVAARVLAECAAKRRIVEFYAGAHGQPYVLHFLALPYADHPDCRQEWRP